MTGDIPDGKSQAAALGNVGMPVYYPRVIADQSRYCTNGSDARSGPPAPPYPRAYLIHDQGGNAHVAYRMTLVMNPVLGQYYGVRAPPGSTRRS